MHSHLRVFAFAVSSTWLRLPSVISSLLPSFKSPSKVIWSDRLPLRTLNKGALVLPRQHHLPDSVFSLQQLLISGSLYICLCLPTRIYAPWGQGLCSLLFPNTWNSARNRAGINKFVFNKLCVNNIPFSLLELLWMQVVLSLGCMQGMELARKGLGF